MGVTKIVADALSRLNIDTSQWTSNVHNYDMHYLTEQLALDNDDLSTDILLTVQAHCATSNQTTRFTL